MIEIEELREAGEDGGDMMGYFARGHIDHSEFAAACNTYTGARERYDYRHVNPSRVRHVWYRTVQMEGEPKGTMKFEPSNPGRGAWAATVAEPFMDWSAKQYRIRRAEFDRGYSKGLSDSFSWVLQQLEWGLGPRDLERSNQLQKVAAELRKAFGNGDSARQRGEGAK